MPLIGVNTFLSSKGSPTILPQEVIRSTTEERTCKLPTLAAIYTRNSDITSIQLHELQQTAFQNQNLFEVLMDTVKILQLRSDNKCFI